MNIVGWIKNNKLISLLLIVVFYLLYSANYQSVMRNNTVSLGGVPDLAMTKQAVSIPVTGGGFASDAPPTTDISNRMLVTDNFLSIQVSNVAETLGKIKKSAEDLGGYMVQSNLDRPEEAASGNITVRVPQGKMEEALNSFKGLAVKVVSENLQGVDVTDQYVDNEARLKILGNNKARFEEIMGKAANVEEILKVQEQIFNLQNQIDSIKGQQQYLSQNAEITKITVYLSTDEFALPYTPDKSWRPEVVFKNAVRSLVAAIRGVINLVIWAVVYAVVWFPALIVFLFAKNKMKKNRLN